MGVLAWAPAAEAQLPVYDDGMCTYTGGEHATTWRYRRAAGNNTRDGLNEDDGLDRGDPVVTSMGVLLTFDALNSSEAFAVCGHNSSRVTMNTGDGDPPCGSNDTTAGEYEWESMTLAECRMDDPLVPATADPGLTLALSRTSIRSGETMTVTAELATLVNQRVVMAIEVTPVAPATASDFTVAEVRPVLSIPRGESTSTASPSAQRVTITAAAGAGSTPKQLTISTSTLTPGATAPPTRTLTITDGSNNPDPPDDPDDPTDPSEPEPAPALPLLGIVLGVLAMGAACLRARRR